MGIDWPFLILGAVVLGALGLGLYACSWLVKYTSMRQEEKLQARLNERERERNRLMQEMRAQQNAGFDDSDITDEEIDNYIAEALASVNEYAASQKAAKKKP